MLEGEAEIFGFDALGFLTGSGAADGVWRGS